MPDPASARSARTRSIAVADSQAGGEQWDVGAEATDSLGREYRRVGDMTGAERLETEAHPLTGIGLMTTSEPSGDHPDEQQPGGHDEGEDPDALG